MNVVGIPCIIIGYALRFRPSCGLTLLTQSSDLRAMTAFKLAMLVKWSWISPVKVFLVIPQTEKGGRGFAVFGGLAL